MRFVIITLPPDDQRERLEAFRRPWNERLGAREALRYPLHVTLRTGLVCPDDWADQAAEAFLDHASRFQGTEVFTDGLFFTTYGQPPRGMAGWHLPLTAGLARLHLELLDFSAWQKGPQAEFHPHLSLAYHDVSPEQLESLRRELAEATVPEAAWRIDHVALYHEQPQGWVKWGQTSLR